MILRRKSFSSQSDRNMLTKLIEKLDKEGIEDYEVTDSIPRDVISISGNLSAVKVYIPSDLEYSQYDIDEYVRSMKPHFRTTVTLDRNIFVMKMSGSLSLDQCFKLVKFIISIEDFCALIE